MNWPLKSAFLREREAAYNRACNVLHAANENLERTLRITGFPDAWVDPLLQQANLARRFHRVMRARLWKAEQRDARERGVA
jgi:hypothetical protein